MKPDYLHPAPFSVRLARLERQIKRAERIYWLVFWLAIGLISIVIYDLP